MKKSSIKLIIIIISLLVIISLFPIVRYLHFYFMLDEYDDKYEKIWVSEDGNFNIQVDNIRGMYGVGSYDGIYKNNGEKYDIEIVIDGISYAKMINGDEVFSGRGFHNIFTNSFTVYVDEVESEYSVYNPGDEIIFHKK